MNEEEKFEAIQKDYWSIIDTNKSDIYDQIDEFDEFITKDNKAKNFTVYYAADLNTNKYGSGFPTAEMNQEFGKNPWNFLNLND